MNYLSICEFDLLNGEGIRVSLFVSGCIHACDGCQNKNSWNHKAGLPFTDEVKKHLLNICGRYDGLTITGGDPLVPLNREDVTGLARDFKELYPNKNIWLWTGYTYEDIADLEIMQYIDVLIDGKFVKELKADIPWRGSSNQRIIRLKQ